MLQSSDVIAAARRHIGTPWRHQGRMPGRGLDCVGLCIVVAAELGLADVDFTAYDRRTDWPQFLAQYRRHAVEMSRADAAPGRMVIIPTEGTAHVGILGDGTLIHAYARRRKVVEEAWSDDWKSRLVAVFAFPGVA